MAVVPIEFPTTNELKDRRQDLLKKSGLTYEQLLDGEAKRSLDMTQYILLDRIRGIDFLLDE